MLVLEERLLLERLEDLEFFEKCEYDVWEEAFDLVVMVSDGIDMESTGGGWCERVEAMVEFVRDGSPVLIDGEGWMGVPVLTDCD